MGTEVVINESRALGEPLPRVDVLGTDTLDRSDVAMPRVRVRQPTSQFGEPQHAGWFYNSLTETFTANINIVVLRVSKGRVRWAAEFGADDAPLCASDDSVKPRDIEGYEPGPCATCAFAQWGRNGEPPPCSLVYTYLCSNADDEDMPFLLSAMRTSATAAKKLNSILKMYGLSRRIVAGTELVKSDKGQWYQLIFKANGALGRDDQRKYADIMRNMAEVVMTVDTDQAEDLAGDEEFPDGQAPF
jgi:hypothetical protein